MQRQFPDPAESPWTHPDTGQIYEWQGSVWVPVAEEVDCFDECPNCGYPNHHTDLCFGVTCGDGEECVDGTCEPIDLCRGVDCGDGLECVDGICEPIDLCRGVNCGDNEECVDGECVPIDYCRGVECGDGLECQDGICVDVGQPPSEGRLTGYIVRQWNSSYGTAVAPGIGELSINKPYNKVRDTTTILLNDVCRTDGGEAKVDINGFSKSKKIRVKNITKDQWFDFTYTQYNAKSHSTVGEYHGLERGSVAPESVLSVSWSQTDEIEIYGFDGPIMGGSDLQYSTSEVIGRALNSKKCGIDDIANSYFMGSIPMPPECDSSVDISQIITKNSIGNSYDFWFSTAGQDTDDMRGEYWYNSHCKIYDLERLNKVEIALEALDDYYKTLGKYKFSYPCVWEPTLVSKSDKDGLIHYKFKLMEINGTNTTYPNRQCWLPVPNGNWGGVSHQIKWSYSEPVPWYHAAS